MLLRWLTALSLSAGVGVSQEWRVLNAALAVVGIQTYGYKNRMVVGSIEIARTAVLANVFKTYPQLCLVCSAVKE